MKNSNLHRAIKKPLKKKSEPKVTVQPRYKPNVRQSINQACELADHLVQTLKAKVVEGLLLNDDELKNLRAAESIIMKARELSIKNKQVTAQLGAPQNNITNNHLISASTEELKALLAAAGSLKDSK